MTKIKYPAPEKQIKHRFDFSLINKCAGRIQDKDVLWNRIDFKLAAVCLDDRGEGGGYHLFGEGHFDFVFSSLQYFQKSITGISNKNGNITAE